MNALVLTWFFSMGYMQMLPPTDEGEPQITVVDTTMGFTNSRACELVRASWLAAHIAKRVELVSITECRELL